MDLSFLRDRRVAIFAAGVAIALIVGLGLGWLGRSRAPSSAAPSLSDGSAALQVEMGSDSVNQDLDRQVRCFAEGQYVGMTSLSECARRNGVAPGALDVGIDSTGAEAASIGEGSDAVPQSDLGQPDAGQAAETAPPVQAAATGPCWLNAGAGWRRLSDGATLDACVQTLFSGRCAPPGAAFYGRWNDQTLRLVPGRVERSNDNRAFQVLARQPPGTCQVPHVTE